MASVFSASNQSRLSKWKSSESGPSPLWEFEPTTEETGPEFDPLSMVPAMLERARETALLAREAMNALIEALA